MREATCKELLKVGLLAEPELRRASQQEKSAEVRIRARFAREQMLNTPRKLPLHVNEVEAVMFSPSGKFLATGGKDGVVRLIDVATGKVTAELPPPLTKGGLGGSDSPIAPTTPPFVRGGERGIRIMRRRVPSVRSGRM